MKRHACAADLHSIEKTPRLCIGFEVPPSKCVACAQDLMSSSSVSWSALQQTPRLCSGFEFRLFFRPKIIIKSIKHYACAADLNSVEKTLRLCIGFEVPPSKCVACAQDLMSRASGFRSSLRQTPRLCSGFDPKWRKCLACQGKSSSGGLGSMFWRTRRCLGARLDSVNVFFQFMAFQGAFLAASRPPWSKLEAILALSGVSWGVQGVPQGGFVRSFLRGCSGAPKQRPKS